jgi:hypothetical protein
MKSIYNFIRNLLNFQHQKVHLGRWSIETCNKKTNRKIDWANEDHCGPCGKKLNNLIKK